MSVLNRLLASFVEIRVRWFLWYAICQMSSFPLFVILQFAVNGNPHSLGVCKIRCPPGLLFSLYLISKPAGICLCIHVKRPFFPFCLYELAQIFQEIQLDAVQYFMKTFQSFKCPISNLLTIVPVNILRRYAAGCPSVYKTLLMERLQVWRQPFGQPLISELWSTLKFWSHWSVKVGGVQPVAAWKSWKEPESWLQKSKKQNRERGKEGERDHDVLVTFSSLSLQHLFQDDLDMCSLYFLPISSLLPIFSLQLMCVDPSSSSLSVSSP